ncbi:hypothetical protein [Nitrosospira multiformis]|uniref:hypothetical protein n=1 Tax=Nitrosospira multiformis TaxID=1231 RepID=UPI00059DE58A|nr:hypothetical protein [Nitrosospira multiformis]
MRTGLDRHASGWDAQAARIAAQKANAPGKITGGRTAGSSGERSARHAYTKAVEWGYVNLHPVKAEVRVEDKKPERATLKIGKLLNTGVGIQAKERQRASNAGSGA